MGAMYNEVTLNRTPKLVRIILTIIIIIIIRVSIRTKWMANIFTPSKMYPYSTQNKCENIRRKSLNENI